MCAILRNVGIARIFHLQRPLPNITVEQRARGCSISRAEANAIFIRVVFPSTVPSLRLGAHVEKAQEEIRFVKATGTGRQITGVASDRVPTRVQFGGRESSPRGAAVV